MAQTRAELVRRVARAARDGDGVDPIDEATHRRLSLHGSSGVAVWTADDGFALRHEGALDLVVAPAARGAGVGESLAAQAVAEPGPLTAWSHGDHPAARALAATHGFDRARALWVMRRPAGEPLADLELPDGIRLRSWRDEDRDELLRVNAAAFAHHPEQGAMDADDLAERMAQDWFDPAGLLIAEDGDASAEGPGRIAGFHWTKRHDERLGEVYVVGIDPASQGRGLGKTLTLAGLHHLRDAGVEEILLYVESDNEPAIGLYSGLGFAHADRDTHVQYRRP